MSAREVGGLSSVENVFAELRHRLPAIRIERMQVKHPADDDNLWFIKADGTFDVQIESPAGGRPPFLIEGDSPDQKHQTFEVDEAADLIMSWLAPP